MTERLRVQVGASPIFKLSAPGFDVDTATEQQLLFDISTANYGGIYLSGIVSQAAFSNTTVPNMYGWASSRKYEIAFGKTFAKLPKVLLSMNDPLLGAGFYGPMYNPNNIVAGTGAATECFGQIEASKLVLYMRQVVLSGSAPAYPANIAYVVYHT